MGPLFDDLLARFDAIEAHAPLGAGEGEVVARSREGRPVEAVRVGRGDVRVSLLGGCHADEPVGPRLLARLAAWLRELPDGDTLRRRIEWWVVPHVNPDGAARNASWQAGDPPEYDAVAYLRGRVRELPGDDIEFGFPRDAEDRSARPEPAGVARWWRGARGPFAVHASLHGMGTAAGPWFLVEREWVGRSGTLRARCEAEVRRLGYVLHDVERGGEKGFRRIARGFATRPDSRAMAEHFRLLGDEATAARFRPSSMEAVRARGGDPLTLVTEMPLFVLPGVGETLGPPDPVAEEWKARLADWTVRLQRGEEDTVRAAMRRAGMCAMPVRDQQRLQWTLVAAGIASVVETLSS